MASLNKLVTSKGFLLSKIEARLLPATLEEFKSITNPKISKFTLLGLDIGKKKCGIAISDSSLSVAMPLKIVATKLLNPYLKYISDNLGLLGLIVGLPLTPHDNLGSSSASICLVINGMSDLINSYNIPLWLHDERYTTVCSYSDLKYSRKYELVDDLCAMRILQEHLDSRNLKGTM